MAAPNWSKLTVEVRGVEMLKTLIPFL